MRRSLALLATASAVLLAGCSGGSGDAGSSAASATASATATASASATASGAAAQEADELVASSRKALAAAESVHIKGTIEQAGQALAIDLRIKGSEGATGSLRLGQGTLQIIRIGTVAYIGGDKAFWTASAGAAAAQQLTGKWVKASSDTPGFSQFVEFTQLEGGWDRLLEPSGPVTKGKVTEIRGVPAVEVTETGSDGGSLFIATEGEPYPLQLSGAGAKSSGRLDFTEYGDPVTLTPPPAARIVSAPGS